MIFLVDDVSVAGGNVVTGGDIAASHGSVIAGNGSATKPGSPAADGKRLVGKQAWTRAAISGGLHGPNQARTVVHAPIQDHVPAGAIITKVYADRDYPGNATVQTSICLDGSGPCIDLIGRHINTDAFNGLDAGRPMSLVHRLVARNEGPLPLYIKSNVTVWFTLPEGRSEP